MPKTIVIFGGFTHEGITASAQALGYRIFPATLDRRTPATWLKHAKRLESLADAGDLAGTVLYLHSTLLLVASQPKYRTQLLEILQQAQRAKVIAFIFQDNLDGIFSSRDLETREPTSLSDLEAELSQAQADGATFRIDKLENAIRRLKDYQARKGDVEDLIQALYDTGIQVAPFYVRADTTIRLQEFFHDIEQGVFLRLFVPSDRLQADQLRSLLEVLERYLQQVEGRDFSIDSSKSERGVVYVFRSGATSESLQTLNDAFARFDSFMKICGDQPEQAIELLKSRGLREDESGFAVQRYARDYKRLLLDTCNEFERKSLMLRQRLEADITETDSGVSISWVREGVTGLLTASATGANVSVNIGNLSVVNAHNISTVVDSVVNGSIAYNDNDKLLLTLFQRYADGLEALQCRSDLDQLKDDSVSEPTRQNARQRLVGFLRKAAKKAGEVAETVAVDVLTKYLDSLLKGAL